MWLIGGKMADVLGPSLVLVVFAFLAVLAILWFILPFAVFGINNRLDTLIKQTSVTNARLKKLLAQSSDSSETGQS